MTITINSYNNLVQAIQDAAEDDSAEFQAYIPIAIDTVEELLYRELDLPDLEQPITGSLTINLNTLAKPPSYWWGNYLRIFDAQGNTINLKKRRQDYIQDYWPNATVTGTPKYYCDQNGGFFLLAPTPDIAYNYEIKYPVQPTKLSVANQTNYFVLSTHPALFYACMAEMSRFMKAWAQLPTWEQKYAAYKQDWNLAAMRNRRDDGATPMNPDNGPNEVGKK